jgi:hypothetical protein
MLIQSLEDRFTEIISQLAGGDSYSYGSGFLLGDGLILTARHVLVSDEWSPEATFVITARPLCAAKDDGAWLTANLVWPKDEDELRLSKERDCPDVALIRLQSFSCRVEDEPPLLGLGDLKDDVLKVTAVGFPAFAAFGDLADQRESHQISGVLRQYSGLVSETFEIDDSDLKAEVGLKLDEWPGFSGAPLFSQMDHPTDRHLIGVVVARKNNGRFDFRAVRIDPLLKRPDFAAVIELGGGKSTSTGLRVGPFRRSGTVWCT